MTALDFSVAILLRNLEVKKLLVDAADGFGIESFEAQSLDDLSAQFAESPPSMAIIEASALNEHPQARTICSTIDRLFVVLSRMDDPAKGTFVGAKTTTFVCEPFDFSEVREMLNAIRDLGN